jgi:hypothetical protein
MHVKRAIKSQERSYLNAVLVLIFSFYDFSECHNFGALRAFKVSGQAREENRKTHDRRNLLSRGFLITLIKKLF